MQLVIIDSRTIYNSLQDEHCTGRSLLLHTIHVYLARSRWLHFGSLKASLGWSENANWGFREICTLCERARKTNLKKPV